MTIRPVTYYEVVCDLCGGDYTGGDQAAWATIAQAERYAAYYRGHTEGGNHVCYRCMKANPPPGDGARMGYPPNVQLAIA